MPSGSEPFTEDTTFDASETTTSPVNQTKAGTNGDFTGQNQGQKAETTVVEQGRTKASEANSLPFMTTQANFASVTDTTTKMTSTDAKKAATATTITTISTMTSTTATKIAALPTSTTISGITFERKINVAAEQSETMPRSDKGGKLKGTDKLGPEINGIAQKTFFKSLDFDVTYVKSKVPDQKLTVASKEKTTPSAGAKPKNGR